MSTRAILFLAGCLAGISPVAAQSCRDDVAWSCVDKDGKYEVSGAGATNSAMFADVSVAAEASVAANMTPRAGEAVAPAANADAESSVSLPVKTMPEDAAAKSGGDQGKAASPGGPRAMLPASWRVAQAETGSTSSRTTTDAQPAAPPPGAVAKPRRPKKTSENQPAQKSGAAIVKEGGKTCSGLDEYRVCW